MKLQALAFAAFQVVQAITFISSSPEIDGTEPALSSQQRLHDAERFIFRTAIAVQKQRAESVKEAFSFAWDGYWSKCKGEDELLPVSDTCSNPRNHWGASAVDALSTAVIMDLRPIVKEILEYVPSINFNKTGDSVSLFETTIRYLGGLLSGYDLLTGPYANSGQDDHLVHSLLGQAVNLANTLSFAFNTTTGIPHNDLDLANRKPSNDASSNGLATTGTLVLEWQHLSDLTNDPRYGALAQKAESYLLHPSPSSNVPFPGLLGTNIDISSGEFTDASGGWNGGDDSYYEYLIKMFVYNPAKYPEYSKAWIAAADSTIAHLASHPRTKPDLTFLASYRNNSTLVKSSQHLACFAGGAFLLAGSALSRSDYTKFGLDLVEGCHATYAGTETGIGPEVFSWDESEIDFDGDQVFFNEHGFYITNTIYDLRPEVIESYYYAYRYTGDPKYQAWAWDAFRAINATCRTGHGFSSILDVNNSTEGGSYLNEQESFLFAEVMKYSYLIFATDAPVQAGPHVAGGAQTTKEKWVFNTEAHPFKVVG